MQEQGPECGKENAAAAAAFPAKIESEAAYAASESLWDFPDPEQYAEAAGDVPKEYS